MYVTRLPSGCALSKSPEMSNDCNFRRHFNAVPEWLSSDSLLRPLLALVTYLCVSINCFTQLFERSQTTPWLIFPFFQIFMKKNK